MRRRSRHTGDSLELLLDTICNTFGGIVFLALLICLLVDPPTEGDGEERAAEIELAIIEATETIESLEREDILLKSTAAQLAEVLRIRTDEIRQLEEETAHIASLSTLAENARAALAQANDALQTRRAKLAFLVEEREQVALELVRVKEAAAKAFEKKQVLLRLPEARESFKRQAVAFVTRGRLWTGIYPATDPEWKFLAPIYRGSVNARRIAAHDLPLNLASPPIDSAAAAKAAIRAQGITGLDIDEAYVVFAIWPDSHAEYLWLRDAVIERGLGYDVLLLEQDSTVGFGGGRGYEQ